jgi:hypothetical protein
VDDVHEATFVKTNHNNKTKMASIGGKPLSFCGDLTDLNQFFSVQEYKIAD